MLVIKDGILWTQITFNMCNHTHTFYELDLDKNIQNQNNASLAWVSLIQAGPQPVDISFQLEPFASPSPSINDFRLVIGKILIDLFG